MKEFYLPIDGIKIHAKLDMPVQYKEGDKCPLCLVIHGLTGHMEERHITAVAKTMNEEGIATLRLDMYGHGKSEGDFANHTLYKWLTIAMEVTDYAKSLDFVTDLYVTGHSQGGYTTMLLAGLRPDDFKAILPLSPALIIEYGAREGRFLNMTFDPDHVPDKLRLGDKELNGNYVRAAQTLHVQEAIQKYHGPVLLVHGDQDEAVPVQVSIDAAKQYDNAKLVIIEGDLHCYNYHLDQVIDAVRAFIKEQNK